MIVRETVSGLSVGLVRLFPAVHRCAGANRFGALDVGHDGESVFIHDWSFSQYLGRGHGVKRLLLAFFVSALADLLGLVFGGLGGLLSAFLLLTLLALSDWVTGTTHRGR